MLDGMFRSVLAMIGITPDEARQMAEDVVNNVRTVDARLARIEKRLGIEDAQVIDLEREAPADDDHDHTGAVSGAGES